MKRLLFLLFWVSLGAGSAVLAQDTIKIGEFGSLTGGNASFGISQNNGVQMALEEVNSSGGVLGKKIGLTVEDNQTKQGQTTTIVKKLISEKKKVAFMTDVKQDYSVGLTKIAKEYLEKNGGEIVKEQSYSSDDKDFRAQLTGIKAANPDVIIITGYYPEAALIAKQARQFGIKAVLAGGDGWDGSSLIPVGGSAVEGAYFSEHLRH